MVTLLSDLVLDPRMGLSLRLPWMPMVTSAQQLLPTISLQTWKRAIDEGIGFDTQGDQFDAETAPASPIAAETRRAPAEDPATLFASKNTWYIRSAQAIARCIMVLTRRLEVNKSIAYFNEWCDTELNVTLGAAYKEAVVRHDQDERKTITHKKTRSLWDNLYFGIMRNLLDAINPAVEAAVQRVTKAYQETFCSAPTAMAFSMA